MIEFVFQYLDRITIVFSFISMVLSVKIWWSTTQLFEFNRRQLAKKRAKITIRIRCIEPAGDKTLDLPYQPRRDQLSRSELQGILGLYHGKDRFDAKCLRSILENGELSRVIEGADEFSSDDEILTLRVSSETFQSFQQGISSTEHCC